MYFRVPRRRRSCPGAAKEPEWAAWTRRHRRDDSSSVAHRAKEEVSSRVAASLRRIGSADPSPRLGSWSRVAPRLPQKTGTSKNFVDGVALRATTNPAAWRIACRRLASSIPRPASRRCLDRREISIAPFGFHHAAGREKRPSPHTKLHEKYDSDIAPCKRPSPHTKTPLCGLHGKGTGCGI